ncbi:MAG: putative baseplate assembly protein [Gallionellaceae bacterium]|nr:putative baseplate assembly protein [Gallionellaceae bacterium]
MTDLTRWNRAGLSRFDYLDGNAAVFLERLRAGLAVKFPAWTQTQAGIPGDETEEAKKSRLEALYAQDPDDMLWQLTRQFARSCHVLGSHVDAYANEATLGTASQWENLRRLVALLDYAPLPPASASAPLALFLKAGKAGTVNAGLQVKHSPAAGAPLIFETLADLEADAAYNTLYPRDHLRNPQTLSGTVLVVDEKLDKLKSGEPLLLEDERGVGQMRQLSAHLVQGILLGEDRTTVTISPAIPAGFVKGYTLLHTSPKEKLKVLGPATGGVASVGHSLQLAVPSSDLAAGDLVVIRSPDDKPYYRRIKTVQEGRLVFYRDIGQLTLKGATVARPVSVPLSDLASPPKRRVIDADGTVVDVVYAAGDWSRLAGQWLARIHKVGGREYLPAYRCLHAKYVPVTKDNALVADDERPGYTALTLTWHGDTDGVPGGNDFKLNNPQTLLAPPPTAGPWTVDTFLNKSEDGRLIRELVTGQCKQTAAGDLAVLVKGAQMAWARLGTVALDAEHEEATLSADPHWSDRGGGPYFLTRTRVYSHFVKQARVLGWQDNSTALSGTRVVLESLPAGLKAGRALIVDNGNTAQETTLADFDAVAVHIDLADALPSGSSAGKLKIYANVVNAGHGESRPRRVLGSGDGTRGSQHFALEASDLSFVADAAMSAGVRAAVEVDVAGETWSQVSTLKDSGPTDAHYQVRIDQDGNADIQFGDGRHGRRLPSGGNNLRVGFRQGSGASGNLAPGSLIKLIKPHPLLDSLAQPIASGGGGDRESNADLRDNAPATLLALDRAVSLEDFSQLARGHASVWQARAFRQPPGLGQRERLEVVVMAAGGGMLSAALKAELQTYLLARAQPGMAIAISDYTRLTFKLSVTVRVRSDAFDSQTVKDAVLAALQAAFTEQARQLGQALYRGEIYKVVDAVPGVENSDCGIVLSAATKAQLARAVETGGKLLLAQPAPSQCLVFDSGGFSASVEEYGL